MKDELGEKIISEFVALRPKTYSYSTDSDTVHKKVKGTKKCVMKRILKFNDYKKCIFDKNPILKLQQRFKSGAHNVNTEEINKIASSSDNDKRFRTFDNIT